jgi:hypothetical protein
VLLRAEWGLLAYSFKKISISFLALHPIPYNFPQYLPTDILELAYHKQNAKVDDSKSETNQPMPPNQ